MITSLGLRNFKNFADAKLNMGPFTVIVGANASGKSNLRDAFRFLHGVGRGYTLADIFGGKYGAGGQAEWQPLRGAPNEIVRFDQPSFELNVTMELDEQKVSYRITVGPDHEKSGLFTVKHESLSFGYYEPVYTSHPAFGDPVREQGDDNHLLLRMGRSPKQKKIGHRIPVRPDQPALTQIGEHRRVIRSQKDRAERVTRTFSNMRFLDLSPEHMRQPAFPGQKILGDSGENLPTVLKEVCAEPERRLALTDWTRELTPMDVADFEFPADQTTGRVQLALRERNGRIVSSYAASDGTLRLLAMLAALLGPNPAGLYVFEEIDNGIHPARQRLLLDLIEGQTGKGSLQVVTTTHSPDLLELVGDGTFKHTSVVCRLPDTDDAVVRPLADLPKAGALRQSQGLGRLHRSNWMEDAILFTSSNTANDSTEVRAEVSVKERYFAPLARQRGVAGGLGQGRMRLGEEAARNITAIRRKCREDFDRLARRIQ